MSRSSATNGKHSASGRYQSVTNVASVSHRTVCPAKGRENRCCLGDHSRLCFQSCTKAQSPGMQHCTLKTVESVFAYFATDHLPMCKYLLHQSLHCTAVKLSTLKPKSAIPACAFVQADVQPFTKVLLQFHDHVMSPNLQLNSAATAVNEKSLTKLLEFVKTLASSTSTYPPAMAEPITVMVR